MEKLFESQINLYLDYQINSWIDWFDRKLIINEHPSQLKSKWCDYNIRVWIMGETDLSSTNG